MFRKPISKLKKVSHSSKAIDTVSMACAVLRRSGYKVRFVPETSHPLSWVTHVHPFMRTTDPSKLWAFMVIPESKPSHYLVEGFGEYFKVSVPGLLELAQSQKTTYPLKHAIKVPTIITSYKCLSVLDDPDFIALPMEDKPVIVQVIYDRYYRFLNPKEPRYKIQASYNVGSDTRFAIPKRLSNKGVGALLSDRNPFKEFLDSVARDYSSFVINFVTHSNVLNANNYFILDVLFLQGEDLSLRPYRERLPKVKDLASKYSFKSLEDSRDKFRSMLDYPIVLFKNLSNTYLQNINEDYVFHSLRNYYFYVDGDPVKGNRGYKTLDLCCYEKNTSDFVKVIQLKKFNTKSIIKNGSVVNILASGVLTRPGAFKIYSVDVLDKPTQWAQNNCLISQILER